jgi:tryptophan 2,3-dioxygenase
MLSRIARVQMQLIQSWEILSTMTPFDYAGFRDSLGQSSGFQSFQYRMLEFRLGNKNARMARVFESDPQLAARVHAALIEPSIYDESLALLARRGIDIPDSKLRRDFSEPYVEDQRVTDAWRTVYRDVERHWDLYELAEKLVDIDDALASWRHKHVLTVERIIGSKAGTGGSAGAPYLRSTLEKRIFPELWSLRTAL